MAGGKMCGNNIISVSRGLFYHTISISDYRGNGGQLINNKIEKDLEGNNHGLLKIYPGICLDRLRKTIKTQSRQEVFQPIFKTASLIYKSKALLLHQSTHFFVLVCSLLYYAFSM
jgi:hypothetical protein